MDDCTGACQHSSPGAGEIPMWQVLGGWMGSWPPLFCHLFCREGCALAGTAGSPGGQPPPAVFEVCLDQVYTEQHTPSSSDLAAHLKSHCFSRTENTAPRREPLHSVCVTSFDDGFAGCSLQPPQVYQHLYSRPQSCSPGPFINH